MRAGYITCSACSKDIPELAGDVCVAKAVGNAQRGDMMRRQPVFLARGSGEPLQVSEPSHGASASIAKRKRGTPWK